jgi:hypothetical protein
MGERGFMRKLLTLGLILCLGLPAAAWGQAAGELLILKPGVEYMGSKQVEKQCPASSAKPGPFTCAYPPSPYPPSPSVPPMTEAQKLYQAEKDQAIQVRPDNDIKKKAIEERYIEQSYKENHKNHNHN